MGKRLLPSKTTLGKVRTHKKTNFCMVRVQSCSRSYKNKTKPYSICHCTNPLCALRMSCKTTKSPWLISATGVGFKIDLSKLKMGLR